jgi:predicted short-subunit dehydrogenase-like oxidoreductase (DUF2520 family)
MQTVIIGSGNIATVFGEKMLSAGHGIRQVVARREEPAAALAGALRCPWTTRWADIDRTAELYLVAIGDTALEGLWRQLALPGKLVIHTAGSLPTTALERVSDHCGVIWPLQSIRAEIRPHPPMPLLIDAQQPEDLPAIRVFAQSLSPTVAQASDLTRKKLHLAATLVNNFTNYLYTLSAEYCHREQIDFSLLLPLIRETAERLDRYPPADTQTGPAARGDTATIETHLKLLDNYPNIKLLYELFTIQIEGHYRYERTGKI